MGCGISIPISCDFDVFVNIGLILLIYICGFFSLWPIVLNENGFEPNFKIVPPLFSVIVVVHF